jgi:toxin FitB
LRFLLDTNVISELSRREPAYKVTQWFDGLELHQTFLSVVSVSEIRRGISLSRSADYQLHLTRWFEGVVLPEYRDRVLVMDIDVADVSGDIVAKCQRLGRPIEPFDAVIAATAEVHGLTLVTRNTKDFEAWGGPVFDPWA